MTITVLNSEFVAGITQVDGRVPIVETHTFSDGRVVRFEYLATAEIDSQIVMQARADRIQTELNIREASLLEAANGEAPITKYQFRQRFTASERQVIDAFHFTFESNENLTAGQKAAIRTNLEDFYSSLGVYLNNPTTVAGVELYEALGLIAAGRAAEILSNG